MGGLSRFSIEKFLSHSAEKVVGQPFRVSLISGIEKCYASEGYVTISRRRFFVPQYQKTLQGNPFVLCFRKFPVAKKFMDKRGGGGRRIKIFRQNFLVSQCQKISLGNPSVMFQKSSGSQKVMDKRVGGRRKTIKFFRQSFLSHSAETFRRGTLLCCVPGNFR